jgi:hypothetical protein
VAPDQGDQHYGAEDRRHDAGRDVHTAAAPEDRPEEDVGAEHDEHAGQRGCGQQRPVPVQPRNQR